jgi:hypothetical protein
MIMRTPLSQYMRCMITRDRRQGALITKQVVRGRRKENQVIIVIF